MFRHIIPIVLLSSLLPFGALAAESGGPLNGKEVKRLITGNTVEGQRQAVQMDREYMTKSVLSTTYFAPNGQLVEKNATFAVGGSVGHVPVHGTWKVKKGKLCTQYTDALKDNRKKCYKVVSKGGGEYELLSGKGKVARTWNRILPGNPNGLE